LVAGFMSVGLSVLGMPYIRRAGSVVDGWGVRDI
jgi:hypothetical protein